MFLRSDHELGQGGGAAAVTFGRVAPPPPGALDRLRHRLHDIDWTPDLGARIGSADWWRGAVSCVVLVGAACWLLPRVPAVAGATPAPLSGEAWEEARTQSIMPLAWGATTGRRLAAGDLVRPLAETPERPQVELTATVGAGDDFSAVLQRAGVAGAEARAVERLVARSVSPGSLKPGTQLDLTLGRRTEKTAPRPLEALSFRARFDLNILVNRTGEALVMTPQPIAVDNTPLRIRGLVGQSLYRSARAAGAPAKAVEAYIRAIASRVSIGRDVSSDNVFDMVIEQARAATGEVQLGKVLYAGIERDGRKVQLVRWGEDGGAWYDASGTGERRGQMAMPVDGRMTSNYGARIHPILGIRRMHYGLDIGAPYGAPIRAAMDGAVAFAGRNGGYGNFVKLAHGNGYATGYGHMSRIAVRPGTRVSQGQVIGYVGSTGLSTGPHLHYELWRNGAPVNPRSISYSEVQQLAGAELRRFRAYVASLLGARTGGAN
ncbi:MAG: M23 family metallopeptidase [Sphingomonas sp.]|nr:M23 family metallopeptidase [Sphingomonas sp.]